VLAVLAGAREEIGMKFKALKVGELAKRTGLTVRTLHHYDEIGLLKPSLHTDSGHRLYADRDVARLQQVVSLRQLGLSLDEIRACLDRPGFSLLEVIVLHAARLREQIALESRLCARLDAIAAHLRTAGTVSAEEFLQTIKEMTMIESYYTPEQLEQLRIRKEQLGDERIQQVQNEWPELIAQVRAEMEKGTDPASPDVQALAGRWMSLVAAFTGGDDGISRSVGRVWNEQGDKIATKHGADYDPRGVFEYIGRAMAIAKG
jgi:MerR family transcriptional regulator, thiopeptide resistance regulator